MSVEFESNEPFLDVLRKGPPRLIDELIRITSMLGVDGSWEHALAIYIFRGHPEFKETFDVHCRPNLGKREADIFVYGLLRCFHPFVDDPKYSEGLTAEGLLEQWQIVTRNLLQVDIHAPKAWSWLYGWAMYGAYIYDLQSRPRNTVFSLPGVSGGSTSRIERMMGWNCFIDELPPSLEAVRQMHGVGEKTIQELTKGIIVMMMDPKQYAHPTMEEMMAPGFDDRFKGAA